MFQTNTILPALAGLPLAGNPIVICRTPRRSPTLSRRELKRLIADMID
ncbi:hypothetical protein [Sphingopyxis sp.]|nr:hypothetical protein [Sphingopyxis sp.]MCW0197183.1 hypothetical protein [Sphingopyxis sp.]